MNRFFAWTRKEFREQRWALIGVTIAVMLVTAFPYVVMPDEITPQQLDHLPGIAIALATLVLGLDLFARETRRGTHALILRTPGAFRTAFPAKIAVFLLGIAITLGVEEAVRHTLTATTDIPYPTMLRPVGDQGSQRIPRDMSPEYVFGIRSALFVSLLALSVGIWHVAGSVISPRAGVGALFGVLWLAVLSIPIALLLSNHPWWFRLPTQEAFGWLAGLLIAGAFVAAAAWYFGRRYLFPRRRAAMRAGLVGLLLCGLATGATARAIDHWETPDARAPELRIQPNMTFLGTGGKRLYVTTSRGPHHGSFGGFFGRRRDEAPPRSSPPTAWTIDISAGARVEDVHYGAFLTHVPYASPSFVPVPFVVRVQTSPPKLAGRDSPSTWVETEGNRLAFTVTKTSFDARMIVATRAVAKATTVGRDSQGRRVWRLFGHVERDGDEDRVRPPAPGVPHSRWGDWFTSPGVFGWMGTGAIPGSSPQRSGRWSIDVESGNVREIPLPAGTSVYGNDEFGFGFRRPGGPYQPIDDGRRSATVFPLDEERSVHRYLGRSVDGSTVDSGWQVVERATGASRRLGGPTLGFDVVLVDVGTLLIRDPADATSTDADGDTRLTLWKPIEDERRPVTSPDPSLLSARSIEGQWRLPDGRWTILLYDASGFRKGRVAVALLDAKSAVLTPLAKWSDASLDPIAVDVDGSFLAIEDGRRVVRFFDSGAKRVVVWPK